jgi:tetratricopeptide (TPR) repeat protein
LDGSGFSNLGSALRRTREISPDYWADLLAQLRTGRLPEAARFPVDAFVRASPKSNMTLQKSQLVVEVFGRGRVSADGDECLLSPQQFAFVAIICGEVRIARTQMARIMWRAEADARVRHRLRQLFHIVNREADCEVVTSQMDDFCFNPSVHSDLNDYHRLIEGSRLHEAASLLSNGLLAGREDRLSPSVVDWRDALSHEIQRQLQREAQAKWNATSVAGDWSAARDAAEACHLLRPDDPSIVAQLVEARARQEDSLAAELAYVTFRERHPHRDAPQLEAAIARTRSSRLIHAEHRRPAEAPFVGRASAIAGFEAVFSEVRSASVAFATISGEAGIGKTRLLAELRRLAALEGFRCLSAQPTEPERRISLNPLIDALAAVDLEPLLTRLGEPWCSVIAAMLPSEPTHAAPRELPPVDERGVSRRLMDAFSSLLRELAAHQPTIFFIDDFHWADETTVAALRFYQRRHQDTRFGVIATVRSGYATEAELSDGYGTTRAAPVDHVFELKELGEAEARDLVGRLAGDEVDDTTLERLFALAGRHPLYLTEVVRDHLAGRLDVHDTPGATGGVPISIRQILKGRSQSLSDLGLKSLALLAVAATPMSLSDVADLLGDSLDAAADSIDELQRCRLVRFDRDQVWITHDLFRQAIYNGLSAARCGVLHLRLAEHVQHTRGLDAAGRLAFHYDRAGKPGLSARFGWIAGDRAMGQGAIAEAAHFFELVGRNETDEEKTAEASLRLGTALYLARDMNRAAPALELASARLRRLGLEGKARRVDVRRVEALAEAGTTHVDELVARLKSIIDEGRTFGDWIAVALALDMQLQLLQLDERLDRVHALIAKFREVLVHGCQEAAAIAHRGLAIALMLNEPDAALVSGRAAVELAEGLAPELRLKALNRLLIVLLHQGRLRLPESAATLREARDLADNCGDRQQRFSYESNIGVASLDAGDLDRAEVHFRHAADVLGAADMTFSRINLAVNVGELALAQGDYQRASHHFLSASQHQGLAAPRYTQDLVNAGLGLCAIETGALGQARMREEAIGPAPVTWYYDPSILLTFRARLAELRGEVDRAVELLDDACIDLEGRLIMAWIKLRLVQCRLLAKHKHPRMHSIAEEAMAVAADLCLQYRREQFASYLA